MFRTAMLGCLAVVSAFAQSAAPASEPIYKVTVVSRTIDAVNYRQRSGSTKVDFRGTALLPEARGEAKVEGKPGAMQIETEMEHLQPATRYGPEYLTYVLWAVSPQGRAENLGEVLLDEDGKAKLNVSTDLQAFGLIVTAEPYFGVTRPSDVVVMENVIRKDTKGAYEEVQAKYELLPRGQYVAHANPASMQPIQLDKKVPLQLYEAENAVQIARASGADQYAGETFQKAQQQLTQAQDYQNRKETKSVLMTARAAVQTAEDARVLAIKRQQDEALAKERQQSQQAQAAAQAKAQQEAEQRRQAELEAERAARAKAEADAARAQAEAEQQRAQQQAEQAQQQADKARQEQAQMRTQLQQQLNQVLQTRETARGLIVNMSDVLFDTGKYSLKPGAREKLARVAGILLSHPGLKLEIEGFTDNTGSPEFNQKLSEDRAAAVRDYLVQQGVAMDSVSARGLGEDNPVASNSTASGRQQNRRVEMVVSGDVIGRGPNQASGIRTE